MKVAGATGNIDTNSEPFFKIISVTAVPVVFSDAVQGQCGAKVGVTQRYSIKYETSTTQQS